MIGKSLGLAIMITQILLVPRTQGPRVGVHRCSDQRRLLLCPFNLEDYTIEVYIHLSRGSAFTGSFNHSKLALSPNLFMCILQFLTK